MSEKRPQKVNTDQVYADLLKDMVDLIEKHTDATSGIAETAITTLSSFIDPDSRDAVERIAHKLTTKLTNLTTRMVESRDDIVRRTEAALQDIRYKRDALVEIAKIEGSSTAEIQQQADNAQSAVLAGAVYQLTGALRGFSSESARTQQYSVEALTEMFDRVQAPQYKQKLVQDVMDRLESLDESASVLPKLLRLTSQKVESQENDRQIVRSTDLVPAVIQPWSQEHDSDVIEAAPQEQKEERKEYPVAVQQPPSLLPAVVEPQRSLVPATPSRMLRVIEQDPNVVEVEPRVIEAKPPQLMLAAPKPSDDEIEDIEPVKKPAILAPPPTDDIPAPKIDRPLTRVETPPKYSPADLADMYKPSVYDEMEDRDMELRKVKALEGISNAWRRFDKDGSIGAMLDYAVLGGLLTGLLGGLLPDILTRFPALKLASDVLNFFRKGKVLESIKELLSTKWNKFVDLAKTLNTRALDAIDWFKTRAMPLLNLIMESPVFKGVKSAVDKLSDLKTNVVTSAMNAVSPLTSKFKAGMQAVQSSPIVTGVTGALKAGANTVSSLASGASNAVSSAVSTVGKVAGKAGSSIVKAAQGLAASPVGSFLMKNLNRLGNLAMVLDVLTGTLEEATGKKVDDIELLDAVLNPMKLGRFLGNKANMLFEQKMGTSVGSWVYDQLNNDPAVAEVAAIHSGKPTALTKTPNPGQSGASTPVKETPVEQAPQPAPAPTPMPAPAPIVVNKSVSSSAPPLSPSSIPNFTSVDPATGALLFGALTR